MKVRILRNGSVFRWIMKVIWFQVVYQTFNYKINQLNLPHLRNIQISFIHDNEEELITSFSLLSNLRSLSIWYRQEIQDPEFFKDLGMFSNLVSLYLCSNYGLKVTNFLFLIYLIICIDSRVIPASFSNLSHLANLWLASITFQGYEKNSLFILLVNFYISKIDEEFPSYFQNMTRLTNLYLSSVRGENPRPIPFPNEFCNMLYLQDFASKFNNFSGFEK